MLLKNCKILKNGKFEKFPTGITFQADALKQLTKNVIGE